MSVATKIEFDLHAPEVLADPYPLFHRLRREDPVHRAVDGTWYLTRYDDVNRVLKDHIFSRGSQVGPNPLTTAQWKPTPLDLMMTTWMVYRDPPDHTRLRKLVDKAFTNRMIEDMRPHIQDIIDYLLDKVQDAGHMDLIADVAYPLPVMVICDMLGVPAEDRDPFRDWSRDISVAVDVINESNMQMGSRAAVAMTDYFRDLLEQRRKQPTDDLLSAMMAAKDAGDRLTMDELIGGSVFLLWAGHETTKNLIGNAIFTLLRYRTELEKLESDPELIQSAVEEFLRYESPVQQVGRWTTCEVELSGKRIPQNEWLVCLLGAANRDPAQFSDPDRLDLARRPNRHVDFGAGIHYCLGAPLARAEAQIAVSTILRRLQDLNGDTTAPQWQDNANLRGLESFPVTFRPGVPPP